MRAGDTLRPADVARLEAAVIAATARCGVDFSVYVGPLADGRDTALGLHAQLGAASPDAVLLAVDPGARSTEIVTGVNARRWVDDRACALATLAMISSLTSGDLVGGISQGLVTLGDQAKHPGSLWTDQP